MCANTHFYFFKQVQDARGKYGDEMSHGLDFWPCTAAAHLVSAVLHLCRFFDKTKGTLRLYDFLKHHVKGRIKASEQRQFEDDCKFCDPNGEQEMVAKLRRWRNDFLIHLDSEFALSDQQARPEIGFDRGEIQSVIDEAFAILERWVLPEESRCLDGTTIKWPKKSFPRHLSGKAGLNTVLESFRSGIRAQHAT
jgi:hypothetical protein